MPRPFACCFCAAVVAFAGRPIAGHPETAEARAELDRLIAEFPTEPDFYLRRAELRIEHSEWTEAASDLDRASQLAPGSVDVARAQGEVALARRDLTLAVRTFDRLLRVAPSDSGALILRARTNAVLGYTAAAHADYSRAISLLEAPSPDLFLARAALPMSPEVILRELDDGIELVGPTAALVERALTLELKLGRTDAALARLDQLAATAERKEHYWKRRGDILAAAGRMRAAREAYQQALAAIESLPAWLRDSPDIAALTSELRRATHSPS